MDYVSASNFPSNVVHATDDERPASWDLRLAGPFQTVGCGAYHGGNLAIILTQLIADLVLVIQDAEDSATTPSAAYSTFFKNAKNAPFVAEVLTNVSLGAIMRPPVSHMLIGGPTFVCPRPGQTFRLAPTQGTSMDAAAYCEDSSASSAAYLEPTPFIMLCPKFFVGAAGPPTPPVGICPTFNQATNRFRGLPTDEMVDGDSIIHNQLFVLLEELVHYYITSSRVKSTKPEVYDINKAWKLSARKSLGNAASYGYYAACKSPWSSYFHVQELCASHSRIDRNLC